MMAGSQIRIYPPQTAPAQCALPAMKGDLKCNSAILNKYA